MNKLLPAVLLAVVAGSASAQQLSTPAADDTGYALYRLAVLKDDSVKLAPAKAASAEGGRWVLGSYGLHVLRNGASTTEALAQARHVGEEPSFVAAGATRAPLQLTQYEMYERSVLRKPEAEIVSSRTDEPRFEAVAGSGLSVAR